MPRPLLTSFSQYVSMDVEGVVLLTQVRHFHTTLFLSARHFLSESELVAKRRYFLSGNAWRFFACLSF